MTDVYANALARDAAGPKGARQILWLYTYRHSRESKVFQALTTRKPAKVGEKDGEEGKDGLMYVLEASRTWVGTQGLFPARYIHWI
jgi:hypothetical protein